MLPHLGDVFATERVVAREHAGLFEHIQTDGALELLLENCQERLGIGKRPARDGNSIQAEVVRFLWSGRSWLRCRPKLRSAMGVSGTQALSLGLLITSEERAEGGEHPSSRTRTTAASSPSFRKYGSDLSEFCLLGLRNERGGGLGPRNTKQQPTTKRRKKKERKKEEEKATGEGSGLGLYAVFFLLHNLRVSSHRKETQPGHTRQKKIVLLLKKGATS